MIRLDFPTFERPTIAISGRPPRGKSRGPAALTMNSAEIFKAGGTLDNIGKVTVYVKDREIRPIVNAYAQATERARLTPGRSATDVVVTSAVSGAGLDDVRAARQLDIRYQPAR